MAEEMKQELAEAAKELESILAIPDIEDLNWMQAELNRMFNEALERCELGLPARTEDAVLSKKAQGLVGNVVQAALDGAPARRSVAEDCLCSYIAHLEAQVAAEDAKKGDDCATDRGDLWRDANTLRRRIEKLEAAEKARPQAPPPTIPPGTPVYALSPDIPSRLDRFNRLILDLQELTNILDAKVHRLEKQVADLTTGKKPGCECER